MSSHKPKIYSDASAVVPDLWGWFAQVSFTLPWPLYLEQRIALAGQIARDQPSNAGLKEERQKIKCKRKKCKRSLTSFVQLVTRYLGENSWVWNISSVYLFSSCCVITPLLVYSLMTTFKVLLVKVRSLSWTTSTCFLWNRIRLVRLVHCLRVALNFKRSPTWPSRIRGWEWREMK